MIEVAAGVLSDAHGRVLLMQRLPGTHLAGSWEFPGGKLETGETVEQALVRELREELGVEVSACQTLISIPWHYPDKSVRLHALRVTAWRGALRAREGHPLRWTKVPDMDIAMMPAADAPIVTALRLPAHYVITDKIGRPGAESLFDGGDALQMASLKNGSGPGFPLLQLRMPGVPREVIQPLASKWLEAYPWLRGRLLVNHDVELARELGVGVHLRAAQLRLLRDRPLPADTWVGVSCHGAEELELAARLGVDFATLSPVRDTTSHPDASPLGWENFALLVNDARLPVYALGGVGPADLQRAREAGAQGVAGIRAFV